MENNYTILGNSNLVNGSRPVLLIYASRTVPEKLEGELEIFYRVLMGKGTILAGAWHSQFEKKIFQSWLNNPQSPLIYCVSRSWRTAGTSVIQKFSHIRSDKYAVIIPDLHENRISKTSVKKRDQLLLQLFRNVVFSYIAPGGRCSRLLQQAEQNGNNIFIYNHYLNEPFMNDITAPVDAFSPELLDCL